MTEYDYNKQDNKDSSIREKQIISKLTRIEEKCGNAISSLYSNQRTDYFNTWADFWRYVIGANVIPAKTHEKVVTVPWKCYAKSFRISRLSRIDNSLGFICYRLEEEIIIVTN
jgi:hypothetical protein